MRDVRIRTLFPSRIQGRVMALASLRCSGNGARVLLFPEAKPAYLANRRAARPKSTICDVFELHPDPGKRCAKVRVCQFWNGTATGASPCDWAPGALGMGFQGK